MPSNDAEEFFNFADEPRYDVEAGAVANGGWNTLPIEGLNVVTGRRGLAQYYTGGYVGGPQNEPFSDPFRPLGEAIDRAMGANEEDDDFPSMEWTISNPNNVKKNTNSKLKISIATRDEIFNISETVLKTLASKVIYRLKVRTSIIELGNFGMLREILDNEGECINCDLILGFKSSFDRFKNQGQVNGTAFDKYYLDSVAEQAKKLHDIEYSKYKYYPRLKAKVKYGNSELLEEILTVTSITKGIVVW